MLGRFEKPRRLRYQGVSKAGKTILASASEAERFEFKRTADAVSAKVLVAAANAVALEGAADGAVTILVGVDEREDANTGLVTGEVVGVSRGGGPDDRDGLERAKQKIRSRASSTLPVPIRLTLIEEGVATSLPFLRLLVRPSSPPHYTSEGLRVTRQGASTRAITDEELLGLYLNRESEAFHERFRSATNGLLRAVEETHEAFLGAAADLERQLHDVEGAASMAGSEAMDSMSRTEWLDRYIRENVPTTETVEEIVHEYTNFAITELRPGPRAA